MSGLTRLGAFVLGILSALILWLAVDVAKSRNPVPKSFDADVGTLVLPSGERLRGEFTTQGQGYLRFVTDDGRVVSSTNGTFIGDAP